MKREILFRGKTKGMWVYGALIHGPLGTFILREQFPFEKMNEALVEVDPETVGQYIGIRDINNEMIFEGDITRDIVVGLTTKVVFTYYGNFGLCSNLHMKDLQYETIDPSWAKTSLEVIGNIHDDLSIVKAHCLDC